MDGNSNLKLVSPILKKIVYPSLAKTGCFRGLASAGLAVVTYHGVLPQGYERIDPDLDGSLITGDTLRRQVRLLKTKYTIISPEEMLLWSEEKLVLPPRAVLLTCDDGLLNNLTDMLPVLEEEGVRCLFFVTGASASEGTATLWYDEFFLLLLRAPAGSFKISYGDLEISGALAGRDQRRALWWDLVKQLSQVGAESRKAFLDAARVRLRTGDLDALIPANDLPSQRRFRLLNRGELKQLESAGMTIGAHSMSHPLLSRLPPELARTEITESRACLEAVLGKRVWAFAYPFGHATSVTPEILVMAKDAGYSTAFLNWGGGLGTELPLSAIPRIHVSASMGVAELEAHVAGFYSSLQRHIGRNPRDLLRAAQG
jgi:peptidoglycan/xylan/chitin deacetylase (PgdA/CDA1 family)